MINKWINDSGGVVVSGVQPEGYRPMFNWNRVRNGKFTPYRNGSISWRIAVNAAMRKLAAAKFDGKWKW